MPILDYFLFNLNDEGVLSITASDLETTLISEIKVDSMDSNGVVAIPSKLIVDALREISDQPVKIDVEPSTFEVKVTWHTGHLSIPGLNGSGYPILPQIENDINHLSIPAEWLLCGISKTIPATADGELRPVMNGIFFDIQPEFLTFVATDAHKLVKLTMKQPTGFSEPASFILPKKPALLLKSILSKESEVVNVDFDAKNIIFTLSDYKMICRLIDGKYPNYNSVVPTINVNKVIVDRLSFINSIKRVSVCSSQASNLIKISIEENMMHLVAKDTDFSVSAEDNLTCEYSGTPITIGFKSTIMVEMLSNISSKEVSFELADATRPGLFVPTEGCDECEKDMVMLLMPLTS